MSGLWAATTRAGFLSLAGEGVAPPLQPWAATLFNERTENAGRDKPQVRCLPHGVPDSRMVQKGVLPYVGQSEIAPGPIRGPEGVRKNLEMLFAAFPDLRLEIEQILASGDHVVVRLGITATHKGNFAGIAATNKRISFHACNIVELRNGKAIRGRLYGDNAALFQQLGVLSLPKAQAAG